MEQPERIAPKVSKRARAWARLERLIDDVPAAERASLSPSPGDPEDRARDKFEGAVTAALSSLASKTGDFESIATLRDADLSNQADGSIITVAGYYEATDGGGGAYRIDKEDTSSVDDGGAVIVTDGGVRLKAVWEKDGYHAVRWGAIPSNVGGWRDVTTSIQKAIDFCHAQNGGTVILRGLCAVTATIRLKKNVALVSERGVRAVDGATWDWTQPSFLGGCGAGIYGSQNMNAPLLTFDGSDGRVRNTSVQAWDGEIVAEQREVAASVFGIYFRRDSRQEIQAPLVTARSLWGINIEECCFQASKSALSAHLRDLNYLRFRRNQVSGGRGVLFDDIADSEVVDNWLYGSIGPVATVLGSWKNVISLNQIGNAVVDDGSGNVGRYTVTVSGNVFTSASHGFETGALVYLSSTGSLPTGSVATRPYYVVKLTATTFSIAASYPDALAGTVVTLSSAGSGTITASYGPACGLFCLSGGSSSVGRTTVTANRVDQCLEQSYLFWGWKESTIVGNYACEGGFGGVTDYPAFEFDNTCTQCVVHGNTSDVGSASYLIKVGANCDHLDIAGYAGTGTSGTLNISATGTSNCRIGTTQTPAGAVSVSSLAAASATVGAFASGNVLALQGNAGGVRLLTLARTSGVTSTVGIGVVSSGFNFWNEIVGSGIAQLTGDASGVLLIFGSGTSATPRASNCYGELASGTNVAGGSLSIGPGSGTGNATPAALHVKIPAAGSSGATAQTQNIRASFSEPGTPAADDTAFTIYFYDGAAWQAKRVLVGAADSGGAGYRLLRIAN